MELGDGRRTGGREKGENMRLALRQRIVAQTGEVKADAVSRAVNGRNESKRHGAV